MPHESVRPPVPFLPEDSGHPCLTGSRYNRPMIQLLAHLGPTFPSRDVFNLEL